MMKKVEGKIWKQTEIELTHLNKTKKKKKKIVSSKVVFDGSDNWVRAVEK